MQPLLRTCFALSLLYPGFLQAQTVLIGASKDVSLYSQSTSIANSTGPGLFAGTTAQSAERRALIAFDIAGNVPAGATITSVSLTLFVDKAHGAGTETVGLYRVTRTWSEGTSNAGSLGGQGTTASTGDPTWGFSSYNSTSWTSSGGDYAASASQSLSVGTSGSANWTTSASMVSDVQSWLDTPGSNFGWELVGSGAAAGTVRRFSSREAAIADQRPSLSVTYTVVPEPSTLLGAFGLLGFCVTKVYRKLQNNYYTAIG